MKQSIIELEAEVVQLLNRNHQLASAEADHRRLQTAVYVAARNAGILPSDTPVHEIDYLALAKQLGEQRPDEPRSTAVTLTNREVEVACKGATLVDVLSELVAKAAFVRMDIKMGSELMGLAAVAKTLSKRLVKVAQDRGIEPPPGQREEMARQFAEAAGRRR